MERKEYLKLCQYNAVNVTKAKVKYDGIEYYPYAYEMYFDKIGNPQNNAILKDIKANCIVHAKLEKVEVI